MALQLAVDFDQDDWVGFHEPDDAYNNLGTGSVSITSLLRATPTAGASSSAGALFGRYDADRARYGKDRISWVTGTGTPAYILIGSNGVSFTMPSMPAGTYTVVLWARLASGSSANTFRVDLTNVTTTTYASSPAAALTTTWQKFTVTGVTPSPQNLAISFVRVTGATNLSVEITGAMIVFGSTAPTWFNPSPASLAQNITAYCIEGEFGLGFVKRHQHVAPVGRADLLMSNDDKRFSPENTSGPLYGKLKPNRLVQIADPNVGIWWTGWTDRWSPEPGKTRLKRATLSATDARRFLAQRPPVASYSIELPAVIIADIGLTYSIPNSTLGLPASTDGTQAWYAVMSETSLIEWYGEGIGSDWDGVKVYSDLMSGIQGRVWFGRTGGFRTAMQQGATPPASYTTLSHSIWMDAGYEEEKIVNHCEVKAYLRKYQTSFPSFSYVLWELEKPISLAVGESETMRVFFTHDTDSSLKISAANLTVTGTLDAGTFGTTVTATFSDIGATSALLTLTNTAAGSRIVQTAVVSSSQRVSIKRELSKEYEDSASVTANGSLSERIDSLFVQERAWAKQMARYIVNRFKDPRNVVPWVKLQADKRHAEAFACHIGAPVRVTDEHTAHDGYYAVIGEQHSVGRGLKNHTVKVYLEPLYPTSVNDTVA